MALQAKSQYVDPLNLHERLKNIIAYYKVGAVYEMRDDYKGLHQNRPETVIIIRIDVPFVQTSDDNHLIGDWNRYCDDKKPNTIGVMDYHAVAFQWKGNRTVRFSKKTSFPCMHLNG